MRPPSRRALLPHHGVRQSTSRPTTDACPSDETVALHVDGRLAPDERAGFIAHLRECVSCQRIIGALAAAQTQTHSIRDSEIFPVSTWRWKPGCRVGRYVVRGALGRGGMGEIYEALDVQLCRVVAIKVARLGMASEPCRSRVVQEGRTLASLDHPNVVRVFDSGTHEGAAYIVIEHAKGSSLRRWLVASPRHTEDVIRVFRGLARGCAAIHATGLVHRDIKPDNMLISEEGKGSLCDFGLAAGPRCGPSGTTGYIAPEVERGVEATPASDQFAFCVSFAEALDACRRGKVPRRVQSVIRRGTLDDPMQRFGSMEVVAERLAPRRFSTRIALATATAAGSVILFALPVAPGDPCRWKDEPWPPVVEDEPEWSRYRREWDSAAERLCDSRVDTVARACLQQQRRDAAILRDAAVGSAPIAGLDPMSCLEMRAKGGPESDGSRSRIAQAAVARLEGRTDDARMLAGEALVLAQKAGSPRLLARALYNSGLSGAEEGRFDVAAEQFESAHWTALRVDEPGVAADSAIELVALLTDGGHLDEARRWRQNAIAALRRMPSVDPVRWAQFELAESLRHQRLHQFPIAVSAARRACHYAAQLDPAPRWLQISTETRLGDALQFAGDAQAALGHLERALMWQREQHGDRHPATADLLISLGLLHAFGLHQPVQGAERLERALAILDRPDTPPGLTVAQGYKALATVLIELERFADARDAVQRTVEAYTALYPPEHPQLLATYSLRANLAQGEGREEEASRWMEDGVSLANRTLGGRGPMTGAMVAAAGELALTQGDFELSERRLESALSVFEEVAGPEHPIIAETLTTLGNAKAGLGDNRGAVRCYERAVELAAPGPGSALPLLGLARTSATRVDAVRYAELARKADPAREPDVQEVLASTRALSETR